VVTSLPLAWSVELAVRAVAAGCPDGARLLGALTTWLPAPTRSELEWLVGHGDPTCQTAAGRLVEELGAHTDEPLSIDVLGPLRLRVGADEVTNPELRRSRVRTVLALLVLRGPMRRERICDLLWPDLEPAAAAQNLRVTLSRLRRVVEPDRAAGQSTSRIRTHGDSIELAGPPVVDTDLARFNRDLAAADQARSIGDSTEELDCLTRAVELWRGEPLADLAALDELQGEIEFIHRSLVDECLRLGELLLVAGRFDEALHLAEQSRLASPYSERAHRLAIAGQLQRQDRVGLAAAVRSTETMLADLGVEPEASTQMLLRRAAARLGPSTDPDPARYWPSSSRS
jgi:DNA-binding SARP family transcriptional activator